ncbi:MAG: hypothetical protein PF638_08340 [Candidatus Delongbacteria bacterium]|nr:hypothetical protein [Candidatus Delongbacteria bacterium]
MTINILFLISFLFSNDIDSTSVKDIDFNKIYRRYEIKEIIMNDSVSTEEYSISQEEITPESKLDRSGLIYRGIKLNADSGVDIVSGFNLNLQGEISKDLEVKAVLSDDNLALTEEGTSESLSEIDNIYIQFKHPFFLSRMGNYDIKYTKRGEFGNFSKDLSGVLFKTNYKSNSVDAFVSSESSSYKSIEINGIEGIQGPYLLDAEIKNLNEIIPGSEDVYLNGIEQKKGKDYYIDYFSNQIFFTAAKPIYLDDKIIVDLEYTNNDYKKYVYGIFTENRFFNDKLTFQADYYTETDDEENPLSFDGTNEEMHIISDAGNDNNNSYITGVSFAGINEGDYNILPDSLHYEYLGRDLGEYDIVFSKFEDTGEYIMEYDSTGSIYYVYDPINGGDYLPLKYLPLPTNLNILHSNLSYEGEMLSFTAETIASNFEENKIAKNSAANFDGFGDHEKLSLRTKEVKLFDVNTGKYKFSISRKYYNEKLVLAERLSDSDFSDNIGINVDQDSTSYEKYLFSVEHKLDRYLTNRVDLSYYKLSPGIETKKSDVGLIGDFNSYGYKIIYSDRISNSSSEENTLEVYYANTYIRFLNLKISPFIAKEKRMNTTITLETGNMEDKYGLEMNYIQGSHNLKNTTGYNVFSDFDAQWVESKYQLSNSLEYKGRYSTNLTSEIIWNWISNSVVDSSDNYYNLISARSNYNYKRNYRLFIGYETERTLEYNKLKYFYQVEEGTGNYRLVDGEYIPDEFGDYNYYLVNMDDPRSATGVKLDLRTYIDIPDIENNDNILYWLSRIDIEENIRIEERSLTNDPLDLILLNLSTFQNDSTIIGNIESETKLYFLKKSNTGLNYTLKLNEKLRNDYIFYGEKDENTEQAVEFRTRYNDLRAKLGYKNSRYLKYQVNPTYVTDDLSKNNINLDVGYDINRNFKFSINTGYGLEEEIVRNINSQELSIKPSLSFAFLRNGIFRSSFKYINVRSNSEELPYTMNGGLGKGVSYKWNTTANYSFSRSVKGNLYYTGRYYSYDTKPFHEFRVELRMEF